MKKALILTTLMTPVAEMSMQTEVFANEIKNQNEVSNRESRIKETTLKGKVIKIKSGDTLNVREQSNADSKLLFTLNNGEIVTVLSQESNGWLKIQKGNKTGYVNGYYISTYSETIEKAMTTDNLNLRVSASWSSEKLTVIPNATWITVISKGSDWTKVSYNNQEGYVPSTHLSYDKNTSTDKVNYATTTDALNLRKTASWSGEKIVVIPNNKKVVVINKGSDWTKVSYNNQEGYVPSTHLKYEVANDDTNNENNDNNNEGNNTTQPSVPDNTPNVPDSVPSVPDSTPSVPETKPETTPSYKESDYFARAKVVKISSKDVLNVRSKPDADSDLITTLKLNEVVVITKKVDNGWYKISTNNSVGYVNGVYLSIIEESSQCVTTERVNLRSSKSWSSTSVILTIEKNQKINLLEKDSEWAKIEYNGQIGYIPVTYIKVEGDSDVQKPSDSDKVGKIATVNATSLNIRSGPSTSNSILTKVYNGDTVLIKEVSSNGWYKVETVTGITGWCSGDYLINIKEGSLPSYGETTDEKLNNVLKIAKEQLGKPYKYGSGGPDSFDCSGLTSYVYKHGAGIILPRNSSAQASAGRAISKSELQPGDLVFFNTSGRGISHVGIYMGNNEMLHAPSSGKTVEITKMTSSYWSSRYVSARRIIG